MSYNPYRTFTSHWWYYWTNLYGDIKGFIRRVWDYAPLLWEDNDYDFNAILRIMRFKLKRLRAHIENHAIAAHSADRVAELARVDVLLRNAMDEDPDDEWSMHYAQWDVHIKGWKDCKNRKEHFRSLKLTRLREERNWQRVWRYIAKHARGWWD